MDDGLGDDRLLSANDRNRLAGGSRTNFLIGGDDAGYLNGGPGLDPLFGNAGFDYRHPETGAEDIEDILDSVEGIVTFNPAWAGSRRVNGGLQKMPN